MANDSIKDERSGFRQWLDRRTGLDSLLHHALDEPIPGGAKIAYEIRSRSRLLELILHFESPCLGDMAPEVHFPLFFSGQRCSR